MQIFNDKNKDNWGMRKYIYRSSRKRPEKMQYANR